jgi:ATP-dependent Lhr-like helicase
VHVADAQGQPPNIPFWLGEAPGRSNELSASVARLQHTIDECLETGGASAAADWLATVLGLTAPAAGQLIEYLAAAKAALGNLPSAERVIFERFFDETGNTHLVIHSPYGSRINRAWGLALRKRFCRRFNFELQAAALEDSIVISLGAVHSFALEEVVHYLSSKSVRGVLTQAVLDAPIFPAYWRWNASIALAVRRFRNGKRAPAQFQRTDAEDLLATVFPDQLACAENLPGGDREIPDHPLVRQTVADCITAAMDVDGLVALLERIERGEVAVLCRELTSPSPLAQEILGAKPYAFLDDAPAEERRTLAVQTRRFMSAQQAAELGQLDREAIERVRSEAWPQAHNKDELHDALAIVGFVTAEEAVAAGAEWSPYLAELERDGRATTFTTSTGTLWVSAERLAELRLALPHGVPGHPLVELEGAPSDADTALRELVRSRLEALGPVTPATLARPFGIDAAALLPALAALEQQGCVMRGSFAGEADEWCERRLLARIHRYTLKRLRSEIEPVSLADYQRFLFHWQGLGQERREGREALAGILGELQGLALPAAVWEREVLPARLVSYGGDLLDQLSAAGEFVWWRPRPSASAQPGRASTVATSPIALVPRAALAYWRHLSGIPADPPQTWSGAAQRVAAALEQRGALFFVELVQASGLLRVQVEEALGELVARGLVTADSFNGLRALLTPQRARRGFHGRSRLRGAGSDFDAAGRWALLDRSSAAITNVAHDEAVEHAAMTLLRRYGIVFRRLLAREALAPSWRELLMFYRAAEARGEIRGGRFVEPLGGEQFALVEAVEQLRRLRRNKDADEWLAVSAADPLNLAGVLDNAPRTPAGPRQRLVFRNGSTVAASNGAGIDWLVALSPAEQGRAAAALAPQGLVPNDNRTRWLRGRGS